jgi:hypothetical protein
MYNYAYSSFIGRIIIVVLIVYFSIENIYLGLIFLVIIITTSYPLYEGFVIANASMVTSNPNINNTSNSQEVLNYFTNFYCSRDTNGNLIPNEKKMDRWNKLTTSDKSTTDEQAMSTFHKNIADRVCRSNDPLYQQNKTSLTNDITAKYSLSSAGGFFNSIWNAIKTVGNVGENIIGKSSTISTEQSELDNINPCSYKSSNYIISRPDCLNQNLSSQICNYNIGTTTDSLKSSSKVLANDYNLNPHLQQDGQWYINMSQQLCN